MGRPSIGASEKGECRFVKAREACKRWKGCLFDTGLLESIIKGVIRADLCELSLAHSTDVMLIIEVLVDRTKIEEDIQCFFAFPYVGPVVCEVEIRDECSCSRNLRTELCAQNVLWDRSEWLCEGRQGHHRH